MENDAPRPMTPFDELVTSPQLQTVKLLLPYTPAPGRRALAACVKFLEFRQTLTLFGKHGSVSAQAFQKSPGTSPLEILDALRPYLGKKDCEMLDMILNLKDMMSMMDMMKNTSGEADTAMDPMDLLSAVLPPEQQEIFRAYDAMFSQTAAGTDTVSPSGDGTAKNGEEHSPPGTAPDNDAEGDPPDGARMKGDESDERMDEQSGHEGYGSRKTGADPDGSGADLR